MAEEISINVKGPNELKLSISISLDKTVLDLKESIAECADVPAAQQRLIYSGRVLKDDDALSSYKLASGHTVHMVKSPVRRDAEPPRQQLPTMQTGQNPTDPLTVLNGPAGHGVMAGFNPFAQMGVNPNDPNMMQSMLDSPEFLQSMSHLMSNPQILDQIIASNPQLAAMGPQVRQVLQSEQFRQMMSNPDSIRQMIQMQRMLQGMGMNPGMGGFPGMYGAPGAAGGATFPPPGAFGTPTTTGSTGTPGAAPAAPGAGTTPAGGAGSPPTGTGAVPPVTPFGNYGMVDPNLMNLLAGGMGGMGGFGAPAQPADTRPPEQRYETQLSQLQTMGFTNAQQNIRALMATGGNVNAAVEYILNGGGL
ncbi:ubiquitin-domain-containing protein [Dacryopinax primogenitus]|uniref:Ubiquitin-domain-containing protein n=1 Tax=Dacryopinax primogenitus (strain DJM 731) TaxID=1858805 RepID=M5G2S6_DACPD|nr:ubiquitin-domain-containing protein [Dacryopinax primogenitus]EJU02525.1 ubiquitin-domain-containing protein [Dacryopinax primogenitus]